MPYSRSILLLERTSFPARKALDGYWLVPAVRPLGAGHDEFRIFGRIEPKSWWRLRNSGASGSRRGGLGSSRVPVGGLPIRSRGSGRPIDNRANLPWWLRAQLLAAPSVTRTELSEKPGSMNPGGLTWHRPVRPRLVR